MNIFLYTQTNGWYNILRGVAQMAINYNRLWTLLKNKNLNKTYLRENGIHPTSIARMGKNEYIDIKILSRICELLSCDYADIMEYIPDDLSNESHAQ